MQTGKVFLIGAGPGDPELLTIKAVRALAIADVVFLDDLVDRETLQFVDRFARIVEVGKRGGCKSTPQSFIHKQMIVAAREGKVVARLKGGDPFVFGRGGEEKQALEAAGVEVEVISGVTSGLAAPAAMGIPVTHRQWSRGVTLITGHTQAGESVNWQALAASGTTLVIYMGMSNLEQISAELLRAGMAPATPAAAIQHGTLATQRSVVSTLACLTADVRHSGLASPAILVIGEVVSLGVGAAFPEMAQVA